MGCGIRSPNPTYKYLMDTFCIRSWSHYIVNLDTMHYKMCCKTTWKNIEAGTALFNNQHLRQRRSEHLSGIQSGACDHCWDLENSGRQSPRESWGIDRLGSDPLSPIENSNLEIVLGNTCDMACRYCKPYDSSTWAHRLGAYQHSKEGRAAGRSKPEYQDIINQFYAWLDRTKLTTVIISGGEPLIMESFYQLLENVKFTNTRIQINTNLNTPAAYLPRALAAINQLHSNGNQVIMRLSLDGIGSKQEWQRQGSSWETIKNNYFAFGASGAYLSIATTVTPLTLEGIGELAIFVSESADMLPRLPNWENNNVVTNPGSLAAYPWIACYKDEITLLRDQLTAGKFESWDRSLRKQLDHWLSIADQGPDLDQVTLTVQALDDMETRWGGGSWRAIYPKTAGIAQQVLSQGPD